MSWRQRADLGSVLRVSGWNSVAQQQDIYNTLLHSLTVFHLPLPAGLNAAMNLSAVLLFLIARVCAESLEGPTGKTRVFQRLWFHTTIESKSVYSHTICPGNSRTIKSDFGSFLISCAWAGKFKFLWRLVEYVCIKKWDISEFW